MKFNTLLFSFVAVSISAVGAQASFSTPFSCKAALYNMFNKSVTSCTVTVNPQDQSGLSRPKPGSIDTSKYSGTFTLSCDDPSQSILGNNEAMAIFQQADLSPSEVQGYQSEMTGPTFLQMGKLAFDPSQIATISNYAVPYSVEWMMYFVGEAKDKAGNFLGYVISYNGGLMAGCLAN